MTRDDLTDPAEIAIWDDEIESMRGSKHAEESAKRAIELHRWAHSPDRKIEPVSCCEARSKAFRPMPANAEALKLACIAEAERRIPDGSLEHGYVRTTRYAWAILALAAAISPKHASAAFFEDCKKAARVRMCHKKLRPEAEAFGRTLAVEWVDELRRAS